jgi:predicted transcriptional regulator
VGSFKDRFGLGYLGPTGPTGPSGPTWPTAPTGPTGAPDRGSNTAGSGPANYIDDALLAYSRPLLQALKESPQGRARLFDLAGQVGARVDLLSGVTKELMGKGYLVKQEDRVGNDILELTQAGEGFLARI